MKIVSIFLLCLLVSIPAMAAGIGGNVSNQEKELGYKFLPLAKEFGIGDYVFANKVPGSLLFEYIPNDQKLENWADMATVTLYSPTANTKQSQEKLEQIIKLQKTAFGKNVIQSKIHGSGLNKLSFVEYTVGEGAAKEHNLTMTYLFTGQMVGTFQVQTRGGSPDEKTRSQFLKMINDVTNRVVE